LAKTFVLVPVESFGVGGELKCTWRLPKNNLMYVEPDGPAEQDNFFKVCPGNQKPWAHNTVIARFFPKSDLTVCVPEQ
jgi:hypothetical protein